MRTLVVTLNDCIKWYRMSETVGGCVQDFSETTSFFTGYVLYHLLERRTEPLKGFGSLDH